MATKKKTKYSASNPSPAQLRARRKFAAAAKARAKAARAVKRAAGVKMKVVRKTTVAKKRNYTTSGPVRVGGKTYPAGTHFPKQRYTFTAGGRTLMFSTKAEAETIAKRVAEQTRRAVKVKKEELNKNGVTYKSAGGFTVKAVKANPTVKGAARYIVVKNNRKVGAISYRLKSAAQQAARKVGGTVRAVISGVTKRNAEERDAAHPIHVRQYWQGRTGFKSQWQRAHEAGQKQLFKVNPGAKWEARIPMNGKLSFVASGKTKTETLTKAKRAVNKEFWKEIKLVPMKANPSGARQAKAAFQEFTGKASRKVSTNYAPKGSGARGTLAAMGQLKKIYVKGRTALDFKGGPNAPLLARDPKTNQMFVLGKQYKLTLPRRNPSGMEDLGEITRLEYECQKAHLGDTQTVTYFHPMGEEGGRKPHCLVNSEGLIVISGGDYSIGPEGIRN